MGKVRIPSLQHFVTYCGGSVEDIYNRIAKRENDVNLVSYEVFRTKWLFDLLQLRVPIDVVRKACGTLKPAVSSAANIAALDAIKSYIASTADFNCVYFEKVYYGIGRGLHVPVNPPLLLVNSLSRKVLWVSFWSTDKMNELHRTLFGTILEKSVFSLPDLRDFELEFVDLSKPKGSEVRVLRVRSRADFPSMSEAKFQEELDKFVMALKKRISERESRGDSSRESPPPQESPGDLPLFLDRRR